MREGLTRRAAVVGVGLGWRAAGPRASTLDGPGRTLRIIVPFAAGGAADVAARTIGDELSLRRGWNVFVENKPGATGILGTLAAARALADGSALYMGHRDTIVLNPLTRRSLPYDPRQFEPVAFVSRVPGVLLARVGSGIDSGFALVKAAKARPGQVSFASWGVGSSVHLGMEVMEQVAGIELLHVPFQSTGASVQALLAGQVDLAWVTPDFALQMAAQGKALIVGASSATRLSRAPNVPSLAEQGFPGLDLDTWDGLFAPRGTPRSTREELHDAINAALADPDTAARLSQSGHELRPMSIHEFEQFVDSDRRRWRALIESRHLAFDLR